MPEESRYGRLVAELHALRALRAASSILDFQCSGDPPDRYIVVFHGRGIYRTALAGRFAALDRHRIEIRLASQYPSRPPEVRWLTPLWHPNVGIGGEVTLSDIGLPWNRDLGLDLICERLWDVARCGYLNLTHSVNPWARAFFLQRHGLRLPLDARTLRDRTTADAARARSALRFTAHRVPQVTGPHPRDVLVIDQNTPTPRLPDRAPPPTRRHAIEDEVIYIGYD